MFGIFKKPTAVKEKKEGFFASEAIRRERKLKELPHFEHVKADLTITESGLPVVVPETGMDSADAVSFKPGFQNIDNISEAQVQWYISQGFIGYQMCAILMQNWLIDKACSMPGDDAVRNGYEITVNDGTKLDTKVIDAIRDGDTKFKVKKHLREYVRFGRGFGIRVCLFMVESADPDYYKKPFNIDGIAPGSYKGISQIDPYWMVPLLTFDNTTDPAAPRFYEPNFWQIGTKTYHYTHLSIFTTGAVADVLKPAYNYGGVSIPQRIFERVYAAERTANEAPMLAQTKRLTVVNADVSLAIANPVEFAKKMEVWTEYRDNYGVKIAGTDEAITQHDTALGDLDNVIMTQYQLVASIAEVPGTKLLGTQPKGFNSTGEFEESSYHEKLESLQENDMTPLLVRHHQLLIKSEIAPKFNLPLFTVTAKWNPLDAMTATEKANLNLLKAEADATYVELGAIDGQDVRTRVINDPASGYNGLAPAVPKLPPAATAAPAGAPAAGPDGLKPPPLPRPHVALPAASAGA